MTIILLFTIAIAAYTLTAAITDATQRRIPNWLVFPAAAAGILFHMTLFTWNWIAPFELPRDVETGALTMQAETMRAILSVGPWSVIGMFVGLALLMIPAVFGGGGFGDVKFLGALGAWFGVYWVLAAFMFGLFIGAFCSLVIMMSRGPIASMRKVRKTIQEQKEAADGKNSKNATAKKRRNQMPFGIPVAVGTWCLLVVILACQAKWPFFAKWPFLY